MDQLALGCANYGFFTVDLAMKCLLRDIFTQQCRLGAQRAAEYGLDKNDYADTDWNIQIPFQCSNGALGYLAFTVADAKRLVDRQISGFSLATKMAYSIVGEINDASKFDIEGVRVSFEISLYEGDPDGEGHCVAIRNPITECPRDDTPLGRKVQMRVTCE